MNNKWLTGWYQFQLVKTKELNTYLLKKIHHTCDVTKFDGLFDENQPVRFLRLQSEGNGYGSLCYLIQTGSGENKQSLLFETANFLYPYGIVSVDSPHCFYRYDDDINHCTITVGLNKPSEKGNSVPSKSTIDNVNSYKLVNQLPNPRKIKFNSVLKIKSLQSLGQVIAFYKKLGAKEFFGNSFYLASALGEDDLCISVQVKKQAQYCFIQFGYECD